MSKPKGRPNLDSLAHGDLERVHDHSPMSVVAISSDGTIVYANKAALGLFKLRSADLLSSYLFDRVEDESAGQANENRIRRLEAVTDEEFKIAGGGADRCVLISSLIFSDNRDVVQTYLFIRDISRVKKRENLFFYLNQAATALAGTRDTAGALEQIARFIVPKFADWFTIDLLKGDRLELMLLKHEDPKKIKWAYKYRQKYPSDLNNESGPAMAIKTGEPRLVPLITPDMIDASITDPVQRKEVNKIGLHSAIIVAMSAGNVITGLVNFISSRPGRHFDEADLAFAQNFANLVGLALENTRLNEDAAREIELRKQSEQRFRFLTDAIPHKLWTSAADGRATYYNQQWHDYTGINDFESLREKIWGFLHPDDRAAAATEWPAAIAKGEPMQVEHRLMGRDGVYRWHLSRFSAYKNNEGRVDLWVGTSTDIHEPKLSGMELAAANEELTAANEELAAVNEEVATTNEELIETQLVLERTNANLSASESRLKMAIEATGLGTWDYDPVNGALYWSEECRAIFGLAPGVPLSFEAFSSQVHPDDYKRIASEYQLSASPKGSSHYDLTYRIMRFDNRETRWIRVQGTAFFDHNGKPGRYIGTVLDITENKLAQEAVAQSEKLFRSIALNIPKSIIIVIDKDHRYVTVEGDIIEKMGYDRRNYEGKHPREVGSVERYEASRHLFERVLAGERFSMERGADNGDSYMVHFVPLRDEAGEVSAGLIIALDITDIKQAEEKSAKLAAIVESSDDAIVGKTLESVITSWNDSAERMFGYTALEMIGQSIYRIIPDDRQEEEQQLLARVKLGERVEHFETQRLTKAGKLLDVSLTVSPVKDKQGTLIGLSKIARDISEKKQEEQRKNDFIGMVSHELKTPLTSLTGIIQVTHAKLKNQDDAFLAGAMHRANVQVKKMTSMINGFLDVSRLEAGKMSLERQQFDLHDLLAEIVEEMTFTVTTHPLHFNSSGAVWVDADRDKIGSVITNLIGNAVKYSPKGKPVTVAYQAGDREVTVMVIDEGIGIRQKDLAKVFDRFHRVETDLARHVSGFGLGLYLSTEIIRRHQGKIWAESQHGQGSTFYFTLPTSYK